jgi:hypothetical protein
MNEEEFISKSDLDENCITSGEENEESYCVDPDYVSYLQDSFQDEIVNDIFENILKYIDKTGIPICEYLTRDDIEIIIQDISEI